LPEYAQFQERHSRQTLAQHLESLSLLDKQA
jgi:hypothetical protein